MITQFFGERWNAPIVDPGPLVAQVETPVGQECYMCDRPIIDGDQGFLRWCTGAGPDPDTLISNLRPVHRGCDMATSIGHMYGLCSCTGWDDIYERGVELIRRLDAGEVV